MNKATAKGPILSIRALVRDKDGMPKFSKPEMIKHFIHRLTETEIEYLKEKYGNDYVRTDRTGTS